MRNSAVALAIGASGRKGAAEGSRSSPWSELRSGVLRLGGLRESRSEQFHGKVN